MLVEIDKCLVRTVDLVDSRFGQADFPQVRLRGGAVARHLVGLEPGLGSDGQQLPGAEQAVLVSRMQPLRRLGTRQVWSSSIYIRLWYFAHIFAAYPLIALVRGRFHRIPPGHCQKCGYDLTGNESGTCPECGLEVEQA